MPFFGRRTDKDEPPPEAPKTTAIEPKVFRVGEGASVVGGPAPAPQPPISFSFPTPGRKEPITIPESHDKMILAMETDIYSVLRYGGYKWETDPDEEDRLQGLLESLFRKVVAADNPDSMHDRWKEAMRKRDRDPDGYIPWLEMEIEAVRAKAGLLHKDVPKPMKPVPAEAMDLSIREALESFQLDPGEAGVLQVAALFKEAIRKRTLIVMIVDVDPFSGLAFGGGKSQLLYQILYWSFKLRKIPFDPRKDIVYGKDRRRLKRMFDDEREGVWGCDEINQFYDKWNWHDKKNQDLVHALELYRKVGRPLIGACGSIWLLNERIREVIATHRLMITKWDDERYTGEATLFRKFGPPKAQKEEENLWGQEEIRIAFHGLTRNQFILMDTCAKTALKCDETWGLDDQLSADKLWLKELCEPAHPPERRRDPVIQASPETTGTILSG